jgi:hypothetical protein
MRKFTSVEDYTQHLLSLPAGSNKVIRLVSPRKGLTGQFEPKVTIEPTKDINGELMGAARSLTREQIESSQYVPCGYHIDHTGRPRAATKVVLKDGYEFDLSKEVDRLNWGFVKHSNTIALTETEMNNKRYALFFIEMPMEYQAKERLSNFEVKLKAWQMINDLTSTDLHHVAGMLGYRLPMMEDSIIKTWLFDFANTSDFNSSRVIDTISGPDYPVMLLYLKAREKGIITFSDGMYRFNEHFLGASESQMKQMLKDGGNSSIVEAIEAELKGVKSKKK